MLFDVHENQLDDCQLRIISKNSGKDEEAICRRIAKSGRWGRVEFIICNTFVISNVLKKKKPIPFSTTV